MAQLTPLEAINKLYELQQRLGKSQAQNPKSEAQSPKAFPGK
jgi:hypothetical protein